MPGGWFCLDTPNRRVTELQLGADVLSNPDHKLEYTHEHLSRLLRDGGFDIAGAYGLSLADASLAHGAFDEAEVAAEARRLRGDRRLLFPRVHVPPARRLAATD